MTGKIDFVAFHKTLKDFSSFIEQDKKVIVYGKYQKKEEEQPQIIIEKVIPVENSSAVYLNISQELKFEEIMSLKNILADYKGSDVLIFNIKTDVQKEPLVIGTQESAWVNACNDLSQVINKTFEGKISTEIKSVAC